ncbi:G patch domain-containing protein 2-like [Ostrea edulis]|uniref:G patch domain-containing protein 2-like n=1 Tax=Ostrea edulis TaxID=37623 RepID=UPI002095FEA7|nr:G patch domain-containing protein 2-like [Ostrea edulis]
MDHHNIVRQFQNLRVYSNSRLMGMDELVKDLANALEESASPVKSSNHSFSNKRQYKKRKGKKRRPLLLGCGNISEASESSIDETLRDYFENFTQNSDSDDIEKITRLSMPLNSNFVPIVESDSVNESTFSPSRPQRRRKKYKTMAVDSESETSSMKPPLGVTDLKSKPLKSRPCMSNSKSSMKEDDAVFENDEEVYPGKRKRSSKSRGEYSSSFNCKDQNYMETGSNIESSSGLSSSESDGLLTNDEAREADDEQSDFYYESGPACGIPGIIKWWENGQGEIESESDRHFQQILSSSLEHFPKSSQLAFRARVTRMMAKSGRPIRFGRRKLKEKGPGYSLSRFLKEREKWNHIQGHFPSSFKSNGNGDKKRFRKTPPPPSPTEEDPVGSKPRPIPEIEIGNKMLQDMGWIPGSSLGTEGSGIRMPVLTYRRPNRQGLGSNTHPYIRNMDP